MERYGLTEPMLRRQVNKLNELVQDHRFIEHFQVCGVRSRILAVHLTEEGLCLDDPDSEIKHFLSSTIGLVPAYRYPHRLAA